MGSGASMWCNPTMPVELLECLSVPWCRHVRDTVEVLVGSHIMAFPSARDRDIAQDATCPLKHWHLYWPDIAKENLCITLLKSMHKWQSSQGPTGTCQRLLPLTRVTLE